MTREELNLLVSKKSREHGVFNDEALETVINNLDSIKEILIHTMDNKLTIAEGCKNLEFSMTDVRRMMYIAMNLGKNQEEKVRARKDAKRNDEILTPIEQIYSDVFCVKDITIIDYMPSDSEETIAYFLTEQNEHSLSNREQMVLGEYYLNEKSMEEIGKIFGVTRGRVDQILAKALRKLRHPIRAEILKKGIRLYLLEQHTYRRKKEEELLKLAESKAVKEVEDSKRAILADSIDALEPSVRAYNCLRRAGINTIQDLLDTPLDYMMRVRNLGQKSYIEIVNKLKERGLDARFMKEARGEEVPDLEEPSPKDALTVPDKCPFPLPTYIDLGGKY